MDDFSNKEIQWLVPCATNLVEEFELTNTPGIILWPCAAVFKLVFVPPLNVQRSTVSRGEISTEKGVEDLQKVLTATAPIHISDFETVQVWPTFSLFAKLRDKLPYGSIKTWMRMYRA